MKISGIQPALSSFIDKIDNKIDKKLGLTKNINSIGNTTVFFDKGKQEVIFGKTMQEYIKECQEHLNKTKYNSNDSLGITQDNNQNVCAEIKYDNHPIGNEYINAGNRKNTITESFDEFEIDDFFKKIMENANSITNLADDVVDAVDADNNLKKENIGTKENIEKKLPDFITENGLEELNVNERLSFRQKKKRSFKNLLKPLFSPFQFIHRNILPIRSNHTNLNVNNMVQGFNLHSEKDENKSATIFSNRLSILDKTFTENTNEVIKRKRKNSKSDNMIKYHTLERALECKFINDIKILKEEFIHNLAKNKFEKDFASLPFDINSKLNDIFQNKSMKSNEEKEEIFSKSVIDELKKELKDKINKLDENIDADSIIAKTFDAFMSGRNKENTTLDLSDDFNKLKNSFSLMLTKELFNQLSKDKDFIGEEKAILEIDNLIDLTSENVRKNINEFKGKVISELKKGFYENIKNDKKEENLLSRIFKNTSNNINYKWAQDSIILLISYETFENKENKINQVSNYDNSGVRMLGGGGSNIKKNTMIENDLKKIFNRLGLNGDDLDESKDEVLRKYFANYFEHI